MRAQDDSSILAIVKRPKSEHAHTENYSIGMERVAYVLGTQLGLPIPDTWLDEVDGHPSSVQRRIPHARSWRQLGAAMRSNIKNADLWPLAALFDVWTGNTDRRDVNLLFEPIPSGATPGMARGSSMWLIDHGQCGLWPADKFGRDPAAIADDPAVVSEHLIERGEQVIGALMPAEYRGSLKQTLGDARTVLLDRIRGIGDDAIESAVQEVPEEFFSPGRAAASVAYLKARRGVLDTVLDQYW